MEKTGTELMSKHNEVTLLDAVLHDIMRLAENYAAYKTSYHRWGNAWGDEDGIKAARRRLEDRVREVMTRLAAGESPR